MWGEVSLEAAEKRETELVSKFWKAMIDNGATVDRLKATDHDEAWRVVDGLIERRTKTRKEVLRLQEELVELQRRLNETEAGQELYVLLQELLSSSRRLRKSLRAAQRGLGDQITLEHELAELDARIRQLKEDLATLKIPFGRRMQKFFFGR
jgi:predicted RNase H-like nuclease (RuvC/YqgF family)